MLLPERRVNSRKTSPRERRRMGDWSWKQAVAERALEIVNKKSSLDFSLDEVYAYTEQFSRLFPRNRNVRAKVRQILQRLRDDGLVFFRGEGRYTLNLDYADLHGDAAARDQRGVESPSTKRVLRNVRLRDTFLAAHMKRRYANTCQVCRKGVPLWEKIRYCEAHHLRPLGSPHFGPDVLGNIIVLCPNHHVMFDRGAATIIPDTLEVRHHVDGVFPKHSRIYVQSWHILNVKYLDYHHRCVFERALERRVG